jgi:hypothetical protein
MRLLLILLAAVVQAQPPDARELIRQAFQRDEDIFNTRRDYTYIEDQTERSLDSKGRITSTKREVSEVLFLYGEPYSKLIEKNGKPLPAKDAKKEEDKLERESAKRKRGSERGNKDQEEERARRRKTAREVVDAFDFRIAGTETISGRPTWMIDGTPKKNYQAKTREAKYFAKTSGRLWIDQDEHSVVRAEIRVDDTMSFGLFLVRLKPGARIEFERAHVAANAWLPKHLFVKGEAKVGLIKTFRIEVDANYRDYKKFQTESTITIAE